MAVAGSSVVACRLRHGTATALSGYKAVAVFIFTSFADVAQLQTP